MSITHWQWREQHGQYGQVFTLSAQDFPWREQNMCFKWEPWHLLTHTQWIKKKAWSTLPGHKVLPDSKTNSEIMSTRKVSKPVSGDSQQSIRKPVNYSHSSYYTLHGRRLPGHSESLADKAEVGTRQKPPHTFIIALENIVL